MDVFRFKQFSVNQGGCAMKVNTDGVLLGALAMATDPDTILDIGTGTGVISMMLAQRFPNALADAVEIEPSAAEAARQNLDGSPFRSRLNVHPVGFEQYFNSSEKKYDLIVSNPPFYIDSLASTGADKSLARHAGKAFFETLISSVALHLTPVGCCWLILPLLTADLVKSLLPLHRLHLNQVINIKSFEHSAPHRQVISFGLSNSPQPDSSIYIYEEQKVYSQSYSALLKDFLTIF